MSASKTILFVASEVSPFAKTGGLADVANALPRSLKELGHEVRIFMPQYRQIDERRFVLRAVTRLRNLRVPHGDGHVTVHIKSAFLPGTKIQVYFLDYPAFYDRDELYVDPATGTDYSDNPARFALFARAALEMLKKLHWQPEIIHCNDWQTGLLPAYLKTKYRDEAYFKDCRTVLTVHNFAYNGVFPITELKVTGLEHDLNNGARALEFYGKISLLQVGLGSADAINTVSKTYAKEALTMPEIAAGMDGILQQRRREFTGLLNGVDYGVWSPESDTLIPANYSVRNLEGKQDNKRALSEAFGFPYHRNRPIVASISRLAYQKGFDLIVAAIPKMVRLGMRYVVLGRGESKIEKALKAQMKRYPRHVFVKLEFNDRLAHLIESGADMFLMPSRYEPCGLNQLYSMKYGTIPIVRGTGGLADTVVDADEEPERGTGFVFQRYKVEDLRSTLARAKAAFGNESEWRRIVTCAMKRDFSWGRSAKAYCRLYDKLKGGG